MSLMAYIDGLGLVISHLHISHNSPRLPPQNFAQKQRLLQRFWGQTICFMGDEQMANDMTYFSKKKGFGSDSCGWVQVWLKRQENGSSNEVFILLQRWLYSSL